MTILLPSLWSLQDDFLFPRAGNKHPTYQPLSSSGLLAGMQGGSAHLDRRLALERKSPHPSQQSRQPQKDPSEMAARQPWSPVGSQDSDDSGLP